MKVQNRNSIHQHSNKRSKTPVKGTVEYEEYLKKLRLLEQIRLRKLKALEELCKKSIPIKQKKSKI